MSTQAVSLVRKQDRRGPLRKSLGPATASAAFHVMAKPSGPICNLDCEYCFFLSKESLYPGDPFRMREDIVSTYIGQLLEAHPGPDVTIAWQGGEPTLMGVDFFRRAIALAKQLRRPGQRLHHTIQTNGTLLTDEWCELFVEHHVLVGISIDGPPELHDRYRVDKRGRPTSSKVLKGLHLLQDHGVDFNVLCTVNAANQDHGRAVYRWFRDELGAHFIQFIPIVERDNDTGFQEGDRVTDRSVEPDGFGRFLIEVFDEWVVRDVGRVFVQAFDAALASWLHLPASMCVFAETCGNALALEHNGDLYSCDHFVEPKHLLGNITDTHMADLLTSSRQRDFGLAKRDTLPSYCLECDVRFACNGECPKNRFTLTPDGEPGLNYLCAGYKAFFTHIGPLMELMADRVRSGGYADEVIELLGRAPRNAPCLCGSGTKAKQCHTRARTAPCGC
jgi:uncharacterized protein